MSVSIRAYQDADFEAVYGLWQAAMGADWPLTPNFLRRMISGCECYEAGDNFVAETAGEIVGFAATQMDDTGKSGGILLLMVHPEKRRQSIGRQLHEAATAHLRQHGAENISLAHGGTETLWPGVPLNMAGSVEFFKACGWRFPDTCYDLTRDLADYQTPPGTLERIGQQIEIRPTATADEAKMVLAFEQRIFPFWAVYFEMTAQDGRYADILAAWDGAKVVGSLLLDTPDIPGLAPNAVWHLMLGAEMGTIGAVGVDETYRERGIGLAMVARASEMLQARGVRQCMIGWTDLLTFYGRLGYTIWRSYAMTED